MERIPSVPLHPALAPIVRAGIDTIEFQRLHPDGIQTAVERVAYEAYQRGQHDALIGLLTQEQVAQMLGVDASVISRRARQRDIGWLVGQRVRLYRPEDVERLRPRQ